jgi:hypothetical protein
MSINLTLFTDYANDSDF